MDVFLIEPMGPNCWYLSCAFFWYACFWIERKYLAKRDSLWSVLFFCSTSLGILVWGKSLWAQQAISFPLGILLAVYSEMLSELCDKYKFIIASTFCGCFTLTLLLRHGGLAMFSVCENIIKQGQNLSLGVLVILLVRNMKLKHGRRKLVRAIGNMSYEIYLLHGYFEGFIRGYGAYAILPSVAVIVLSAYLLNRLLTLITRFIKTM